MALKKEKKLCVSLQANEEKALAIVEQGKLVNLLNVADLCVLLVWHHVPKTKGAKKAAKLQQCMTIVADGGQPTAYKRWMIRMRRGVLLFRHTILISETRNTGVRWR